MLKLKNHLRIGNRAYQQLLRKLWGYALLILITTASTNVALSAPMTFKYVTTGGNICCTWTVAEGEITSNTPNAFREFLRSNKWIGDILFNSPGGSLGAAMELGELIRERGVETRVGAIKYDQYGPDEVSGECASACAYAFIGGKERSISKGSRLGFHRFYRSDSVGRFSEKQYSGQDLDQTQRMLTQLIAYIQRMGLDAGVINLADKAGPDDMYWVTDIEAHKLKLVYSLNGWSPWTIEPYKNGIITYSTSDDGDAKMTLYCTKREGTQLIISSKRNNLQYLNQLRTCPFDGVHQIFGSAIRPDKISTGVMNDGSAYMKIALPSSTTYKTSSVFDGGNYPRACVLNWKTNQTNFSQNAQVVTRTCVD